MKERPILFNGEMVRAILDGRKTQTRRMVKPQPPCAAKFGSVRGGLVTVEKWPKSAREFSNFGRCDVIKCPFGAVGDRLWVRETFQPIWSSEKPGDWKTGEGYKISYPATDPLQEWSDETQGDGELTNKCMPSIHMPRWASRITLEITGVRVERVQEISEEDAIAEGAMPQDWLGDDPLTHFGEWTCEQKPFPSIYAYKHGFRRLWDSVYGNWKDNPWVWAIEFRRVQ